MINPNEMKLIPTDDKMGLLAEYKTLRDEIISAQGRRLQTMSFTIGAVGVILTVVGNAVLGSDVLDIESRFAIAVGGGIALYGMIIPSQIMGISGQQTIQRIGSYIRRFIEPRVPGLQWENHWLAHKLNHRLPTGLHGMGSIYSFLSLLPLLLPLYMLGQKARNWPLILVLVPFALWSAYLSYDMYTAISKGWKSQWLTGEEP